MAKFYKDGKKDDTGKVWRYSDIKDIREYDIMLPNEQVLFKALAKLLGYEEL